MIDRIVFLTTSIVLLINLVIWMTNATFDIHWQAQAIEHGAAYYHPTSGEFTWKESENGKM